MACSVEAKALQRYISFVLHLEIRLSYPLPVKLLVLTDMREMPEQRRHTLPWMQGITPRSMLNTPINTIHLNLISFLTNMQGTGRNKKNGNMFERWK